MARGRNRRAKRLGCGTPLLIPLEQDCSSERTRVLLQQGHWSSEIGAAIPQGASWNSCWQFQESYRTSCGHRPAAAKGHSAPASGEVDAIKWIVSERAVIRPGSRRASDGLPHSTELMLARASISSCSANHLAAPPQRGRTSISERARDPLQKGPRSDGSCCRGPSEALHRS